MKQIKFFYTLVLISSIAYAQEIPTLNFEQTNNIDLFTFLTVTSLLAGVILICISSFMERLIK